MLNGAPVRTPEGGSSDGALEGTLGTLDPLGALVGADGSVGTLRLGALGVGAVLDGPEGVGALGWEGAFHHSAGGTVGYHQLA